MAQFPIASEQNLEQRPEDNTAACMQYCGVCAWSLDTHLSFYVCKCHIHSCYYIGSITPSRLAFTVDCWQTLIGSRMMEQLEAFENVGPIRHNEPPSHAHSPDVASGTVARRLCIDAHDIDNDDNA